MTIPKFCATCAADEAVYECGTGDTPKEAFNDFMDNGDFEAYCAAAILAPGDDVDVFIYSVIAIEDSDWPEDERDPKWKWCLDDYLETRIVEAV